jgi:hypothetical protein
MKKIVFLLMVSSLLVSCQKEVSFENSNATNPGSGGSNSTYYIRCKDNGTAKSFNYNAMAKIMDLMGAKSLSLIGSAAPNASTLEGVTMGINFMAGGPAVGTYKEDDGSLNYVVAGVYNPGSTTIIFGAGLLPDPVLPLRITITKIDTKEITGTFEGAFYKQDVSTGTLPTPASEKHLFTEGEFKLPIQ